ncbi:hypothetical protein M409DRAFT_25918 [Zasmidium cellare ATCC 36951]|uniref:CST complex subunit Ten1 n=1 Tax=Zasmidium cellare ATCC 36951 TaxID=1080233 RepID=A0A6A6CA74_ZASCE|nr:uncharacterized protein M409DRAFT_25918 [Zasmidium cellare ATCC 36951]KAF2163733.1 hypothetical protein M409DRAFT_25918 [Zasmidium cellare ATCC 36951]
MSLNDQDNWRPVPTRLVQFDQVQQQEQGTKIRFLGCVQAYQGESATLLLSGTHVISKTAKQVHVNVEEILPSVNHELLQVGAWLNIVGYVRKPDSPTDAPLSKSGKQRRRSTRLKPTVVDALMMWTAGAIKLDDYSSAVRSYQSTLPTD